MSHHTNALKFEKNTLQQVFFSKLGKKEEKKYLCTAFGSVA